MHSSIPLIPDSRPERGKRGGENIRVPHCCTCKAKCCTPRWSTRWLSAAMAKQICIPLSDAEGGGRGEWLLLPSAMQQQSSLDAVRSGNDVGLHQNVLSDSKSELAETGSGVGSLGACTSVRPPSPLRIVAEWIRATRRRYFVTSNRAHLRRST